MTVPASAAPTSSIRPSMRFLGANPKLLDTHLQDDQSLRQVLDRQVQIRLEGTGKPSERALVPQTQAAVKLLTGPDGARFEQILRGALSTVDGVSGACDLHGITLATGEQGFAVNRLMTMLDINAAGLPKQPTPAAWRAMLSDATRSVRTEGHDGGVLAQDMSWMDFGPFASRALIATARDGRHARSDAFQVTAGIAAHELQHSLTRANSGDLGDEHGLKPINWLEEGIADALTWQPPALKRMTRAMGTTYKPSKLAEQVGYPEYRGGVERLLHLAGINPRTEAGYDQAMQLLQGGALSRTPGRIADAIAAHHNLSPDVAEQLRTMIRDVPGTQELMNHPLYELVKGTVINKNLYAISKLVRTNTAPGSAPPAGS